MKIQTRVFADADALSRGALEEVLRIVREMVGRTGRCSISLSGGHTPEKMFELWARDEYQEGTPWEGLHLFWGDERYVPRTDPLSNYAMTKRALLDRVPIRAANVHAMPTEFHKPEEAARAYEAELRGFFGAEAPAFDVQLLGLGGEGHTASLFPANAALEEKAAWCLAVTVPADPPQRLTLTYPIINQARNTYFLVAGESKRAILGAIAGEPESGANQYPAARVRPSGALWWYLDRAAAGQ
jgi:6-phosphogluconolactonase